ncbi:sodium/potassium/calcium exchanger 1-like isoform X3 [Symsagittifera roscoffensis]|uniref:sodium/potassium/calcium exchanger 1-like isoform X3 n=1 Tax=Symsagittifera roscoffensis TaxID=84072 RepID=UPI00307CAF1D
MLKSRRGGFKVRKRIHRDPLYVFTVGFILSSIFLMIITYLRPDSHSLKPPGGQETSVPNSKYTAKGDFYSSQASLHNLDSDSYYSGFFSFIPHLLTQSRSSRYDETDRQYFESLSSSSYNFLPRLNPRNLLSDSSTTSTDGVEEVNGSCSDESVWAKKTYPPELVESWPLTAQRAFIPFYIMGTLYAFVALAIICDEFFVAALEVIIEKTELSEDVAGATFMAAGGSAPELFTSLIGMLFSNEVDVGIGTIIGSAVFNVLFVIAVCAFGSPTTLSLTWWPLCRDTFFYSVGLMMIIGSFFDSKIQIWEPVILFCWYLAYCTFMAFNEKIELFVKENLNCEACSKMCSGDSDDGMDMKAIQQEAGLRDQKGRLRASYRGKTICISTALAIPVGIAGAAAGVGEKNQMNGTSGPNNGAAAPPPPIMENGESEAEENKKSPQDQMDEEEEEDDGAVTLAWPSEKPWYRKLLYLCLLPIMVPLVLTIPDPKRGKPGTKSASSRFAFWGYNLFALSFIMSIVWIALWSYLMVWWVERTGWLCCIPSVIMGLTFLAAGTSVPDLITSYLVAKKGFGDMALSSSIGSNLFDICVGLPIPWLIYVSLNVFGDNPTLTSETYFAIEVTSDGMFCYILMLFSMLIFIFVLIMSMKWRLNRIMGVIMLVLYFLFLVFAVLIGFGTISCNIVGK